MDELDVIVGRLNELLDGFLRNVPEITIAVLLLALTGLVARVLPRRIVALARLDRFRRSVQDLYAKLIAAGVVVIGVVAAAVVVFPDITAGRLFTMVGFGSIAIGFAFKDVLENLVAGLTILARSTIRIGDFVEFEDVAGRVEEITFRDTYLRTTDGELVLVPNASMFKSAVRIVTAERTRRIGINVGVAYGTDLDDACAVIERAVAAEQSVVRDRGVEVLVRELGASSVDIDVLWWTESSPLEVRRSRSAVLRAVTRALDGRGIEIPFPQRVLHLPEGPWVAAADREEAMAGAA